LTRSKENGEEEEEEEKVFFCEQMTRAEICGKFSVVLCSMLAVKQRCE
jgi:hypothetical protein